HFFVRVELEAIDEAELLDRAHRDGGENAHVGDDRDDSTQSETRSLGGGQFHIAANDRTGNVVQVVEFQTVHATETGDGEIVGGSELDEELCGIDFEGFGGAGQAVYNGGFNAAAEPGFLLCFRDCLLECAPRRGGE